MGLSGVSIWELLIILLIVVMIFGTKRLNTLGSDLGSAIRGFKKAMDGKDEPAAPSSPPLITNEAQPVAAESKIEEPASAKK
ncbi:MAG TPA: twin-arginine translocase TatA/TatE family subunit [Gammaproteobacteria bacterium]|nr:twin-arginine translocase TatA/TatE family subunit [Gammaproteobacteria bacterium]